MTMPALPADATAYRTVGPWDQDDLPAAIRADHSTKPDVWGRVRVLSGSVDYVLQGDTPARFALKPGVDGIIPPAVLHHLAGPGPFVVEIDFLRVGG